MENFIVIAPATGESRDKLEDHRIQRELDPSGTPASIPAGYSRVFGPASLDECTAYLAKAATEKDPGGKSPGWFWLTVAQYGLIVLVTITFVAVIVIGALKLQAFDTELTARGMKTLDDGARTLITFLVAVSTVAIAFLAILTAMVVREYKERFALAKEVLTLLVGILGTIVGFYFGTASNARPAAAPSANTSANSNTNAQTNAGIPGTGPGENTGTTNTGGANANVNSGR